MNKFTLRKTIDPGETGCVVDVLSSASGISHDCVKDALYKGALWLRRSGRKNERLRDVRTMLNPGDCLEFNYDKAILGVVPPKAGLVADEKRFSVWYKPPGLLTQGTRYGDHCSLLRQVELFFQPSRPVFPVHRLDREVAGLVLIAHGKKSAAELSSLIRKGAIHREYRAEVRGNLAKTRMKATIDLALDGKSAVTEFYVLGYDQERDTSKVAVTIKTGRLHQIRRHFNMIGFPVMGDPRYGRGNKNRAGLCLEASSLRFQCPLSGQWKEYQSIDHSPGISSESGFRQKV
ncbi:MAG: RluA family pseudouridine synthase [Syntrophales bacterium]|nr:RluA family pseudouridine synthase [Syntrophales bacterium]